jgi:hypothetical protein
LDFPLKDSTIPANPLLGVHPWAPFSPTIFSNLRLIFQPSHYRQELRRLLAHWFQHSPFSLILSDALLLSDIENDTHDPALLAVLVGIALTLEDSPAVDAPAASPPASPMTIKSDTESSRSHSRMDSVPRLDKRQAATFLDYASNVLFARTNEQAVSSISTMQALLVYGAYLATRHLTRRSWVVMCSGYALTREAIKRSGLGEGGERKKRNGNRSKRQRIEDELLVAVCWIFCEPFDASAETSSTHQVRSHQPSLDPGLSSPSTSPAPP